VTDIRSRTAPPEAIARSPGPGFLKVPSTSHRTLSAAARRATLFNRLLDEQTLAEPARLPGALEACPQRLGLAEPSTRGASHDRPPRGPMLWDAV